jgi:hypothetical protein
MIVNVEVVERDGKFWVDVSGQPKRLTGNSIVDPTPIMPRPPSDTLSIQAADDERDNQHARLESAVYSTPRALRLHGPAALLYWKNECRQVKTGVDAK